MSVPRFEPGLIFLINLYLQTKELYVKVNSQALQTPEKQENNAFEVDVTDIKELKYKEEVYLPKLSRLKYRGSKLSLIQNVAPQKEVSIYEILKSFIISRYPPKF